MTTDLKDFAGTPCLIYPASRLLEAAEAAALLAELNAFLADWASHELQVASLQSWLSGERRERS